MSRKTLYFDCICDFTSSAVMQDGKLIEFHFEKNESKSIVGNIYKGKVKSVLSGMQAAFVDCGLERNCYLSAETNLKEDDLSKSYTMPRLKEGDEILVQVVKPPINKKGAKVTTNITFVGKSLIYIPLTPFVGVSRKIKDDELRRTMLHSAQSIISENEGLVVRTAAPYIKRNSMLSEYNSLKALWNKIKTQSERAECGSLVYEEAALPNRILRDTLSFEVDGITVGSQQLADDLAELMKIYPVSRKIPVTVHKGKKDLFDEAGISKQIVEALSPKVKLDNGAYIVIERTEALTSIDVNTGKFVGDDCLEQTVYYTNILAAREIARQVKLRNICGIIVVDFIDMSTKSHQAALVEELKRALSTDSSKCDVAAMSKFGLVEFTRKRMASNPLQFLLKPCPNCQGGFVKSEQFMLFSLRAKIMDFAADGFTSLRVDINDLLFDALCKWTVFLNELREKGVEIYAVPHKTFNIETIKINKDITNLPDKALKI